MKQRKRKIQTLETLLARTEEYGECMEWKGYHQNKTPHVQQGDRFMSVRQLMWELLGKKLKAGYFYGTSCNNPSCVNPKHIVERSHSDHAKKCAQKVNHNALPRLVKLAKAAEKRRILSQEQVCSILIDQRPSREIANDFGVSKSLICRIKSGKAHKTVNAMNNPFWGLMA